MTVDFRRATVRAKVINHSAKGSEWEKHKYIKKIDGNYYYPDNYEGGRHLDDDEKRIPTDLDMDSEMIDTIARDVIKGLFGNGADRKLSLGDSYQKIQNRVNEILRSSNSENININDKKVSTAEETGVTEVKKVVRSTSFINMNQIYSAYGGLNKDNKKKTSKESNVNKRRL